MQAIGKRKRYKNGREGTKGRYAGQMKWCWFYDRNYGWDFARKKCGGKACYSKYFIHSRYEHSTSLESMEQFVLVHKSISRRSGGSEQNNCLRGNERKGKENKIKESIAVYDLVLM